MALVTEPKILRANSLLMTATRGAFLSSCHVKGLPDSRAVPAAWKYSGEMADITAEAAAFDGLKSVVSSVKTVDSFQPPLAKGGGATNPTDSTPGIVSIASIMRLCMAGTASPR